MTKAEDKQPAEAPAHTHTAVQPASDGGIPLVAMILGIVSLATFMLFLGVPAMILGIIGLKKYPHHNRGFSIAGIVTGAISTLFMVLFALLMIVAFMAGWFATDSWSEPNHNDYRYDRPLFERHGREGA